MVTRYELQLVDGCGCDESGRLGNYTWLRRWHDDDPVDDAERLRNDLVCGYQGNRNPYVDDPSLVEAVFDQPDEAAVRALACEPEDVNRTIAPGDVLLVGVSLNPDDLALVFLRSFPNGVDLGLTDKGWIASSGSLRGYEGIMRLQVDAVSAGDVFTSATARN